MAQLHCHIFLAFVCVLLAVAHASCNADVAFPIQLQMCLSRCELGRVSALSSNAIPPNVTPRTRDGMFTWRPFGVQVACHRAPTPMRLRGAGDRKGTDEGESQPEEIFRPHVLEDGLGTESFDTAARESVVFESSLRRQQQAADEPPWIKRDVPLKVDVHADACLIHFTYA